MTELSVAFASSAWTSNAVHHAAVPAPPSFMRLNALPPVHANDLLPTDSSSLPLVRSAPAAFSDVTLSSARSFSVHGRELADGIRDWLVPPASAASAPKPPTDAEVKLLREALGALYGERNPDKAEVLLTRAIAAWERQPPDERAALYRIRGDCYSELRRPQDAVRDFDVTIELLEGPGGELADPAEVPAAHLGRARAIRSLGVVSRDQSAKAAEDYRLALRLTSREEWDTDAEREEDGAARNPYAAWEWGSARRGAGDYAGAAEAHAMASIAFEGVGDRARAVISALDAGIDLAAATTTGKSGEARKALETAIKRTTSVEGGDVALLQRVIAKEGEARMALASVLWDAGDRAGAEAQLGEACVRLDQLEADAAAREAARIKSGAMPQPKVQRLGFSIDDIVGAGEISCSRFKNKKFLTETLMWPNPLKEKLATLENLGKK